MPSSAESDSNAMDGTFDSLVCQNLASIDEHFRVLIDLDSVMGQRLHDALDFGAVRSVAAGEARVSVLGEVHVASVLAVGRDDRALLHDRRLTDHFRTDVVRRFRPFRNHSSRPLKVVSRFLVSCLSIDLCRLLFLLCHLCRIGRLLLDDSQLFVLQSRLLDIGLHRHVVTEELSP